MALHKEITVMPGLTLSEGTFGKCTFFCFPETSHFCFLQHQWLWCFWACGGPVEFRNRFSGQYAYVWAIIRCVYFFLVSGFSYSEKCKGSLQVPTIEAEALKPTCWLQAKFVRNNEDMLYSRSFLAWLTYSDFPHNIQTRHSRKKDTCIVHTLSNTESISVNIL